MSQESLVGSNNRSCLLFIVNKFADFFELLSLRIWFKPLAKINAYTACYPGKK